jgi:hypothetical protein
MGAAVVSRPVRHLRSRVNTASTALLLGALTTSLFLLVQQAQITGDGLSVYEVAKSIVRDGDLSVDQEFGVRGRDGEYFSKYGIGLSLFALIPYTLVLPVAELSSHSELIEQAAVASLMPIFSGLLVVALFQLSRRLGAGDRPSALLALGTVMGTFVLPYTKDFFGEPVTALFLVLAVERWLAKRPGQAGLALAAACLVRPQAFAFAPVLAGALAYGRDWRGLRLALAPLLAAALITVAYNDLRFGGATETGYVDVTEGIIGNSDSKNAETFSTPLLEGAELLLLHPAKSLLLFAPVLVLVPFALWRLWRSLPLAACFLAVMFIIGFVTVAAWSGPGGGFSWGPRLLIPVLPCLLASLAPWMQVSKWHMRGALALFAVGFAVSAPAVPVSAEAQWLDVPRRSSPRILRQYELVPTTTRYSIENIGDRGEGDHRRYLNFWQVGVARQFGPVGFLLAIPLSLGLGAIAIKSAHVLGSRLRSEEPFTALAPRGTFAASTARGSSWREDPPSRRLRGTSRSAERD